MKKFIYASIIAILLISCTDFTSPERNTEQQYYLTGLLVAGKSVDFDNPVIFGKTISTENGSFVDLFIGGANVTLYEMNNSGSIQDSVSLFCFPLPIPEINDTLFLYIDIDQYLTIKPEMSYKIEVKNEDDLVWAVTQVPKSIHVWADSLVTENSGYTTDPNPPVWPEMVYDTIDLEHPIQIETQDNDIINLLIDFYCLEEWYDARLVHAFGGEEYLEDEEDYENPGDGSPRKTSIFYTFLPNDNLVNFSFYQYAFVFYGRYEVTVKSIDDNYLHYIYKPEGYNYGGINGGIGYFGSASSSKIYTKIVEE
ncbi:MAG: hypothetical protein Q7J16_08610 [Candidatus Cloacimonadales bacterium]|nr:hypothetical protein [Candidatus Cloacimonadales bacterium]